MSGVHLCGCGCGQPTGLARLNDRSKGWVKGEPLRFIRGHMPRRAGAKAPRWKGGRHIDGQGYVVVTRPDGSRQREHILIAEKALGRQLKFFGPGHPDNEVVHHVYGDRADNEGPPYRLVVCTHAYHTSLHARLEKSPLWPQFKHNPRNGRAA